MRSLPISAETVRYVLIGVATFLLYSALLWVAKETAKGVATLAGYSALAFIAATTFNYFAHYHFTFAANTPHTRAAWRFVLMVASGSALLSALTLAARVVLDPQGVLLTQMVYGLIWPIASLVLLPRLVFR